MTHKNRKQLIKSVEVCDTGHIIMFKVILKLFATTFYHFFAEKAIPTVLLLISGPTHTGQA
jgi:hypothetical protein